MLFLIGCSRLGYRYNGEERYYQYFGSESLRGRIKGNTKQEYTDRGRTSLAYYAIRNAISSNYIIDVIVRTDSSEVEIIANKMDAEVRRWDPAVCAEDVILNSLVFDAIPADKHWDFIIILQPTSATLKVKTLDKAIEYIMANDLDTVISYITDLHLSSRIHGGRRFQISRGV